VRENYETAEKEFNHSELREKNYEILTEYPIMSMEMRSSFLRDLNDELLQL